jgi:hypothetical protein
LYLFYRDWASVGCPNLPIFFIPCITISFYISHLHNVIREKKSCLFVTFYSLTDVAKKYPFNINTQQYYNQNKDITVLCRE